jgi:WD40 repeat protein
VVTGDVDGVVRVGPVSGEEPHLLFGHKGAVNAVAVDPKGRWVASAGVDSVVRLWPIPEGKPVHTLPRHELLDLLRELTNYRVVADSSTADGYRLEVGSFPGWESVPTW